uniref:Uncharacterized protein n=1 Tax=Mustela putorius furo TaxID=9669 RepID=M3YNM4_MUSPF
NIWAPDAAGVFNGSDRSGRALEDGNENGGLPISGLKEQRARDPSPQCALREKRSITPVSLASSPASSSPGLCPNVSVSGTQPHVESPNPADSCLQRRKVSLPGSATCGVRAQGAVV